MKITALMVLYCNGVTEPNPIILAKACDVSKSGFFIKRGVGEFIVFVGRTHTRCILTYNRNGLCALGFMDDHYPVCSAFSVLHKVLDEYEKNFGDSWKTAQADDPAEADKFLNIQKELYEAKFILHETIDKVLARGEKLDSLVEKSADLSAASQMFYRQAKETNQCCTIS
ncbi:hypothetical protein MKW98_031581 [Papaver atlanticum]|uniref:Uncharacterized protein n=1 Tax=Papaver atlanticum TaxID=357466 RepID=A0AAD4S5I1_9MAGN|nr:hypothetical protein MKW98_031581 [Papaver atlanticum]